MRPQRRQPTRLPRPWQEHWSGLPFPSPIHESEKWKWSCSVLSHSSRPHGLQPTRLFCPWNSPAKNTGWVAISFSWGSSLPRDQTRASCSKGIFHWSIYFSICPYPRWGMFYHWALEWGVELIHDEQQHEWEINGYCWATEIWGVIYCHSLINLRWLNRKWCSKVKCCSNARKIQNIGFGVSHSSIEKTIMKAGKMVTYVCSGKTTGKTIICYFLESQ